MLESLTIFSKGGLILYQYLSDPSLMEKETGRAAPGFTAAALNQTLIQKFLLDPSTTKSFHISDGITFVWVDDGDKCIVALYPDILFEGPRQYLREWATSLVGQTLREYDLYQQNASQDGDTIRPDPAPFDKTFRALLNQSKSQNHGTTSATNDAKSNTDNKQTNNANKKPAKKGKEKRTWGDAKVTQEAMAELDMSKKEDTSVDAAAAAEQRALAEARAAYLPTADDLQQAQTEQEQIATKEPSWSSTAVGWFQQMTGNKVLEAADLEAPLKEMESFLSSKNVANEIAHELCRAVEKKLVGKKLNSLYRVQTAVQQALEGTITKILHHDVDLLRNALAKRGDSLFSVSKKTPYVVAVVGINGVGEYICIDYTGLTHTLAFAFLFLGCLCCAKQFHSLSRLQENRLLWQSWPIIVSSSRKFAVANDECHSNSILSFPRLRSFAEWLQTASGSRRYLSKWCCGTTQGPRRLLELARL